jgi:hypothetical protein
LGTSFERALKSCDESKMKNANGGAAAASPKCPVGGGFRDSLTKR